MTASSERPTHLRAADPECPVNVLVLVNGEVRKDVTEADAAEGWAEVIVPGRPVSGVIPTERIQATVEFVWYPDEGWKHCTDPLRHAEGSVFGWWEGGRLWSGIVRERDHRHLRVRVDRVGPGTLQ
jgi:hypothetical protein